MDWCGNVGKFLFRLTSSAGKYKYEFGITDLALDVLMEKVILGVQTLKCDDVRISKQILESLLRKNVPGFCTELKEACDIFEVSMESLINASDVRHVLKEKVNKIQETELMKRMVGGSKMDGVILEGFVFEQHVISCISKSIKCLFYKRTENRINH